MVGRYPVPLSSGPQLGPRFDPPNQYSSYSHHQATCGRDRLPSLKDTIHLAGSDTVLVGAPPLTRSLPSGLDDKRLDLASQWNRPIEGMGDTVRLLNLAAFRPRLHTPHQAPTKNPTRRAESVNPAGSRPWPESCGHYFTQSPSLDSRTNRFAQPHEMPQPVLRNCPGLTQMRRCLTQNRTLYPAKLKSTNVEACPALLQPLDHGGWPSKHEQEASVLTPIHRGPEAETEWDRPGLVHADGQPGAVRRQQPGAPDHNPAGSPTDSDTLLKQIQASLPPSWARGGPSLIRDKALLYARISTPQSVLRRKGSSVNRQGLTNSGEYYSDPYGMILP